ncbi:MAG: hypothetical protein HY298_13580 [Verrucomicrobia bacterium]|nr:hypothetical protein [Verrucomicrobiota bacterium]
MKLVTEAFVSENLFEVGLGYVLFTRFRAGDAESGVFMLDVYCRGVKDAFYTRSSEVEYRRTTLDRILKPDTRRPLDPPAARKLVEGAVAYARNLGFAPHPDYAQACRVLGGTSAADSAATFTFGKNGKPFYVQGRFDSFETCLRALNQLRARCGNDNFDFLAVGSATETRELERQGFTIRQKVPVPPADLNSASHHR